MGSFDLTELEGSKKKTQVLSLYDKSRANKGHFREEGAAKFGAPKTQQQTTSKKFKTIEAPSRPSIKQHLFGQQNSSISKVKELLTTRKPRPKTVIFEYKKNPQDGYASDIVNGLKQKQSGKVKEVHEYETSDKLTPERNSLGRLFVRFDTTGAASPNNNTFTSLNIEKEDGSGEYLMEEAFHFGPYLRQGYSQNVISNIQNANLRMELHKVVEKFKDLVQNRDSEIERLKKENELIKAELEDKNKKIEMLSSKSFEKKTSR